MDLDAVLLRSPTVRAQPLGDELNLFDTATGQAVALNRTAADLFWLADGRATVGDMMRALAKQYGLPGEDVAQQSHSVLQSLLTTGMLRTA